MSELFFFIITTVFEEHKCTAMPIETHHCIDIGKQIYIS